MTEPLYLKDSYLKECEATVVKVDGNKVILDKTIFYPRGGGQPHDTGYINDAKVIEVKKENGEIVHVVEGSPPKEGEKVRCKLDWERRYKLMRMHTAAHVLASVFYKDYGAKITGNQLGEEKTRFDFNVPDFNRELLEEAVQKANTLLQQDLELKIYELPREEALKIPEIVKLAGALPPSLERLRIVEIPGIDIQADGGTHVRNLREVGQIKILKMENKGKNNRRIYFTLV
ncbi:MAG: alanyl-tRNA editing protein [Candidatus Micrarchaeota archaeon]|nr:alanyl-tRNA editing protein [Candidatus Micrarchaeota archaeon]